MRFLFTITFIILIFANTVKAQMINFNCNFIEGGQSEGGKDYPAKKMQALKIILDKDKKLVKDNKRQFDPYTEDKDTIHWTHNWTEWSDKYSLNLTNNHLEVSGSNKTPGWTKNYRYNCVKVEKKPSKDNK
jgi:hypothetical protein